MKSNNPKIILLGNNAGNNLGDAAIMSAIMDVVSKEMPNAEFYVPSIKPKFIDDNYGKEYNVKGVDVMPWTGSLRLFGIPTLRLMAKCDAALICDGIIFGKKLFNPAFNFLITLIALLPFAKLLKCKLVCYSCGIGPFPSKISKLFAKWLMNGCDLITLRENDSIDLAREIGVSRDILHTGDAAFINKVSEPEVGKKLIADLGLNPEAKYLGINVTKYMDGWLYSKDLKVQSKSYFLNEIAEGVKKAKQECNNEWTPLIFSTHPMDEAICEELAQMLDTKVINNSKNLSHAIQSAMLNCDLFMGMRFHSLILASAVGNPIIGLNYAPKVRGYMRLLDCEDLGLELANVRAASLAATIEHAWNHRSQIREKQQRVVADQKAGAIRAAKILREKVFGISKEATAEDKISYA